MKGSRPEAGAAERHGTPWWEGAVGYQIYVRSFADGNGDGMGDLPGICERLDYLSWLGVDAVWLTPFYPSPGHDHGYDVSDYCGVSPLHGSLDDFDLLVERAHSLGLRVVVDFVPNHTSIEHQWFAQARQGRDSPGRARYLWADPAPDGGPPNNWRSHFGGPAWTLDEKSGQYWCHLFLPEQPDLNWRNEEVREAFDGILHWWIDRGVDGFRVDVAHGLVKDAELRDNPQIAPLAPDMDPFDAFEAFEHRYDMDQVETVDVFRRWNRICAPREVLLLGEVNVAWPERMRHYVAPGRGSAGSRRRVPSDGADHARRGAPGHLLGAEQPRPVAGGQPFRRRRDRRPPVASCNRAAHGAGGMPFLYQGEELGLSDGVLRGDLHDPVSVRNPGAVNGRDGCRTPMPWDSTAHNGFSTGEPWIDAEPRPAGQTVASQRSDPGAPVHRYRELLAVRRRHPDLWRAPPERIETADPLVAAVRRGSTAVVANLADRRADVRLGSFGWETVFASREGCHPHSSARDTVSLSAESAVVLVNDRH